MKPGQTIVSSKTKLPTASVSHTINIRTAYFLQDGGLNHKQFLRYIKSTFKDQSGVAPLNVNGLHIYSTKDKAEALNSQFQSVFSSENLTEMPDCTGHPYPSIPDISISVDGIKSLLESLDVKKATGPDGVPGQILKLCAAEIAPVLTVIFNQSLNTGELPKDWLTANITPVFKKGDRCNPTNYRPISLTPICSKIMEYILYHSIIEHLNLHHIRIRRSSIWFSVRLFL